MKKSIKAHWVGIVFCISLVWTIVGWSSAFSEVKDAIYKVPVLLVLAILFEICFDVGIVMLAVSAGQKVFAGVERNPKSWMKALGGARKRLKELLYQDSTSALYRRGLMLNWIGAAAVTGVIPIIAVVTLLPWRDWTLMIPAIADLVATFGLRLPLAPKVRRLKEEVG